MDPPSPTSLPECADGRYICDCHCCSSASFRRTVKRKVGEPGHDPPPADVVVRVDVEIEVAALRETVASQQETIRELSAELEEERNASATAASETMSMILRLQHVKSELQMEARQFRRFAEEKMAHDAGEIAALEDLLFKREQEIEVISCEVRSYENRILGLGFAVASDPVSPKSHAGDSLIEDFDPSPEVDYPPLRCEAAESYNDGTTCLEKNTPRAHEQRIHELKTTTTTPLANPSPRRLSCSSKADSFSAPQEPSTDVDRNTDQEEDEIDRVCTIDAVHGAETVTLTYHGLKEESGQKVEFVGREGEIKELYMRLQALEADRESMRQEVVSFRSEKAQLVFLGEIAQKLYREVKPERKIVMKKRSLFAGFSFVSFLKWIMPFLFWRKNSSRSRYAFGLSSSNPGLLQILDKSRQTDRRRCLSTTTGRKP